MKCYTQASSFFLVENLLFCILVYFNDNERTRTTKMKAMNEHKVDLTTFNFLCVF